MRRFPLRYVCVFRVDFVPVPLFSCDNWLALVRGNRGDGLPVPGRTGGVHITTWSIEQNHTNTNKPMAIKAFMMALALTLFQILTEIYVELRFFPREKIMSSLSVLETSGGGSVFSVQFLTRFLFSSWVL